MKKSKITSRVVFSIALIFMLIITTAVECNAKPQAPAVSQQTIANPEKPPVKVLGTVPWSQNLLGKFKIIYVPGHYFDMGSPDSDPLSRGDEKPQTRVKMPGFFMFGTEVTNLQYTACEESGTCTSPQTNGQGPCSRYRDSKFADVPVVCINWHQANTFCQWVEGKLPSEAEWEKAARGVNNIYPWGDQKPTCDLTNMAGCTGTPGPVAVGSYPKGASPFGLLDMAGNVREWVEDWYQPNYQKIGLFDPNGPADGKMKIVRGGGWNDFTENLRTAARVAYPPETTHEDVGFRCVPQSMQYAPFCPSTYINLCTNPNIPTGNKPCTPGAQTGGGKTAVANFGCPAKGQVTIAFDSKGGGNEGFSAMVNGQDFTCSPGANTDTINCSGPQQRMGSTVNITVCGGGQTTPDSTTPANNTPGATGGSIKTNLLFASELLNMDNTIGHNCPDGYIWQETPNAAAASSGECVLNPNLDCPQGWDLSASMNCQPRNDQSCPAGTKMNRDLGGCVPDNNTCPKGFVLTEKKTCEPEQNDRKLCPAGYYFNRQVQCCQPIRGNNYNCGDNHYFDPNYKRCMPIDGNGCGYQFEYDGYSRCQGTPYADTQAPGENQCPGNLNFAAADFCNTPPDGYNQEKPNPISVVRPGDSTNADGFVTTEDGNHNCGQTATFVAAFNSCVNRDSNNCPYGYHFAVDLKRCIPDNGPGSGCPQGYSFQRRLGCCVPTPGYDSSRCPQDKQTAVIAAVDTSDQKAVFAVTNYDPQQGACDPGQTPDGQPAQCPPGYPSTNNQPCTFNEGTAVLAMSTNGNQAPTFTVDTCPQGYWDQQKQACTYQPQRCGDNEYYDYYLGYCVPLQSNCCQLGQSYSALLQRCAPDTGQVSQDSKNCEKGYEMVNGQCLLIGRGQGSQCVTISINVPNCNGPCKVGSGLVYNPNTGQCEKPATNCHCVLYDPKTKRCSKTVCN